MSHPSNRSVRLLALALAAALLMSLGTVACGSDDGGDNGGGSTAAAEPLSESEYLKQVNDAQTDFATAAAKLNLANPSSPKDFKSSLDELVGLIDTLTERLDEIEPPEQVAAEHARLSASLRTYQDVLEQQKGALGSDDDKQVVAAAAKIGAASKLFSKRFAATIDQLTETLNG
jgi:hypothetical protein